MKSFSAKFVVDTNLLIDFYRGKAITVLFRVFPELTAPDVIIEELIEPDGESLMQKGLKRGELTSEQVQQVYRLVSLYPKPSRRDLFALVLAKTRNAVLLTGDRNLRKAAWKEGVAVHGTLWVLDMMLRRGYIKEQRATRVLCRIVEQGSWLPAREVEKRLKAWKT